MLDRVSSLELASAHVSEGLRIAESPDFVLTQVAGDAKALKRSISKAPERVGIAVEYAGKLLMRIGPHQLWVIGTPPEAFDGLYLTPLSSSRARIEIKGHRAREVLVKCAAIDFHPKQFKQGQFVMTGIHHMPVLIHCTAADAFHIYAMRTFALHLWEILTDAGYS
jgi:methylglutamate dehydrogenase subunit D